jgi:hypothetical protein
MIDARKPGDIRDRGDFFRAELCRFSFSRIVIWPCPTRLLEHGENDSSDLLAVPQAANRNPTDAAVMVDTHLPDMTVSIVARNSDSADRAPRQPAVIPQSEPLRVDA